MLGNNLKASSMTRFAYLDNIKSFVILSVIALHAATTYSGIGPWRYIEVPTNGLSLFELATFGVFISFLNAWHMGILFFISAFLMARTMEKHGPSVFIKKKLFRLGLPLLVYIFIISPFIVLILIETNAENTFAENYIHFIQSLEFLKSLGPLWFVKVLLFFCVIYAIIRQYTSKKIKIHNISFFNIACLVLLAGVVNFFARISFPLGKFFFSLPLSVMTTHIVMLILGVLVGENNLLDKITDKKNIKWLLLTPVIGMPVWAFLMLHGSNAEGNLYHLGGGFYWQSFVYSLWEVFTAFGFSVGFIALFRKKVNAENKFSRLLKNNSFGIYFFHALILIATSIALKNVALNPLLKFFVVTLIVCVLTLVVVILVKKIKPIGILLE
jgi:surface polysaccharide O-acyltransferase-like enzyme